MALNLEAMSKEQKPDLVYLIQEPGSSTIHLRAPVATLNEEGRGVNEAYVDLFTWGEADFMPGVAMRFMDDYEQETELIRGVCTIYRKEL